MFGRDHAPRCRDTTPGPNTPASPAQQSAPPVGLVIDPAEILFSAPVRLIMNDLRTGRWSNFGATMSESEGVHLRRVLATERLSPDPRKLLLEIGQPLAGVESQLGQGSHSARFGKRMNARHVRMGLMAMVGLFMVCGASYHIGYGVGRTAGRTAGVQAERACWIMAPSSPHGPFVAHRDVRHPLLTARVDRRPHGKLNIIDAPFPARSEDPRRPNQPAEATETRGSVSTMKTGDRPGR